MNLLILTVIIIVGFISQIEAASLDTLKNILENRKAEDPVKNFSATSQFNGNKEDFGFDRNIHRIYGSNSSQNFLENRQRPITSGFPKNIAIPKSNGDVDPEVAKQFPGVVDLLNNLRELNKLKAEGKLSLGENKHINKSDNNKSNNNGKSNANNLIAILQPSTTTESNEEVDPAVAKLFPGLVKLLNRLKQLNKLKQEGKLSFGGNNNNNKSENNKPDSNEKNDSKNNTNNNNNNFQAQPVMPEN